ncbi:GDP-mannose 4,6-dehydratase [Pelagibacterales bacterium SAG-MED01]|nr:GDP-mannose 4,6-dehydratase [Pelagibacterales bacterium SAG-MED01]
MKKKALILGATGQDGSYMVDLLLKKKYQVHGLYRKSSVGNTQNIDHLISDNKIFNKKFFLHKGDLLDTVSLNNIINEINPNEIYNFADQDHVGWSYEIPSYSFQTTALSVIEILEIIRKKKHKIKYFQPISSNIFGETKDIKQNENTSPEPNSIYALAKTTAYYASKMYSKVYNLHICGAIFFNHESPKRHRDYVSKKIVQNVCEIFHGKRKYIYLGNIKSKIDWGYAKEYVEFAWKIMQKKQPNFYVIGSGKNNSVEYFVKKCFQYVGLDYKKYIKIDKKLFRPSKTRNLLADTSKAKKDLKFKLKTDLDGLIKIMMDAEMKKYNG